MVDSKKYLELLSEPDFKIFGFSKECLMELRHQYILRGGPVDNINVNNIIKVFSIDVREI